MPARSLLLSVLLSLFLFHVTGAESSGVRQAAPAFSCPVDASFSQPTDGRIHGTGGLVSLGSFSDGNIVALERLSGINDQVCAIRWWGFYLDRGDFSVCSKNTAFDIAFHEEAFGLSGPMIAGPFRVNPTRVDTGELTEDVNFLPARYAIIQFDAEVPCTSLPNVAWMSISAVPDAAQPDCIFNWSTAAGTDNFSEQTEQESVLTHQRYDWDLAFCLTTRIAPPTPTPIPTPSPTFNPVTTLEVGILSIDVAGSTVNDLGGGNYDISAGATINRVLSSDGGLRVRGTTITGSGVLRHPENGNVLSSAFSIDAATGIVSVGTPVSTNYRWKTVPVGICSLKIDGSFLEIDGWLENSDFAGNGFENLRVSSSGGHSLDNFFLGADHCNPANVLRFSLSNTQELNNGIRFFGVTPAVSGTQFSSLTFDDFQVLGGNTVNAPGTLVRGGHTFRFDDIATSSSGMRFVVSYDSSPGVRVTFNGLSINTSGVLSLGGGSIAGTGWAGNFSSPTTTNGPVLVLGDVTIPTTTGFGAVKVMGARLDSRQNPAGLSVDSGGGVEIKGIPFTFPSGGTFGFAANGFTASAINLSDIDQLGLSFNSLFVNGTTVTLGGGGYDLGGLTYNWDVTDPDTGDGIKISGGFGLPDNLAALGGLSIAATITILDTPQGTKVQLNAIEFCTPSGPELKIKKSNISLPQLCFSYDEGPPEEFSGDVSIGIPSVLDIMAGFGVRGGRLNRVSFGLDSLNIAIDSTGAFLQSVGARMDNLSRLAGTWTDSYLLVTPVGAIPINEQRNGVPPIRVTGTMGVTAGPQVLGQALISADVRAMFDETQFRLDGTMSVLIIEVGGGYLQVRWSGLGQGVAVGGYMTYLAVIRGDINAALDFAGNFYGCASVSIQIPDGFPFAGTQFGSIGVCVANPPFKIRGCVDLFFTDLCLTISANGKVSVSTKDVRVYAPWEVAYDQPMRLPGVIDKKSGEEKALYLSMFTNYRQGEKFYARDGAFVPTVRGTDSLQVTVPAGNSPIVRLTFENPNGRPEFNLTSPTGDVYTPQMTLNTVDPKTTPAVFYIATDPERRDAGYILKESTGGTYTVEVLNPETLGEFAIEVLEDTAKPEIRIVDAAVEDGFLFIDWDDSDPDSSAKISIGLDPDRFDANGRLLATDIDEDEDTLDFLEYDLALNPIQAGIYWPYAIIDDGANNPVIVYADLPIFVPDVDSSMPIEDFQVGGANGTASVSFTPVDDPKIVSYTLSWTDDPANWLMVNSTSIPAGENALLLTGLENNKPYKFSIASVSYRESSPTFREGRFSALDRAVKAIDATKSRKDRFGAALSAIESHGKTAKLGLAKSEQRALASQAERTAHYNGLWRKGKAKDEFRDSLRSAIADAAKGTRGEIVQLRYADSYYAVSDTVVLGRSVGENDSPMFLEAPLAYVKQGDVYRYSLLTKDAEGDTITHRLLFGPEGMTVSPEGTIEWDTTPFATGPYDVEVVADDGKGGVATRLYILDVVDMIADPAFAIGSKPSSDVMVGNTWSYDPFVVGGEENATRVWTLVDGPAAMTIEGTSGKLSWDTSGVELPQEGSGLASERVLLSVRETGTATRTAVQEFSIDIENRADIYESVIAQNTIYFADFAGNDPLEWTQAPFLNPAWDEPEFDPTPKDALAISGGGSLQTAGAWTSPLIDVPPGATLDVRFRVRSSAQPDLAPTLRFRVGEEFFRKTVEQIAESTRTGDNSPGLIESDYFVRYEVPTFANRIRLNLDLLSFEAINDANARVDLLEAEVKVVNTGTRGTIPSAVYTAKFDGTAFGWTQEPFLSDDWEPATYDVVADAIRIGAGGAPASAGAWTSPLVPVTPGTSLDIRFRVRSNVDAAVAPTLRFRVGEEFFRKTVEQISESTGNGENSPNSRATDYTVRYDVPDYVTNIRMNVDLLQFETINDANAQIDLMEVEATLVK